MNDNSLKSAEYLVRGCVHQRSAKKEELRQSRFRRTTIAHLRP